MASRILSFAVAANVVQNAIAAPLENTASVPYSIQEQGSIQQSSSVTSDLVSKFKLYSEWSAAAYCGFQQHENVTNEKVNCGTYGVCDSLKDLDTKTYHVFKDKGDAGATGFVAADNTNKEILLVLRGSVSMGNWIADILYPQMPCGEDLAIGIPGGKCEQKAGALEGVARAIADHPDYRIVITGHSLGGAGAVIGAVELRKKYPEKEVILYTYGQPRVGNEVFSAAVTAQGKNYSVTHNADIVPQLPWETIKTMFPCDKCDDYTHISPEYHITAGLGNKAETYHVFEGLKNYEGNAKNKFKPDIIAHIQYFQSNMYECVLPIGQIISQLRAQEAKRFPTNGEFTMEDLQGLNPEVRQQLTFTPPANATYLIVEEQSMLY